VNNPDQCVICHNPEMTSSNTFAGWIKPTILPSATQAFPGGKPWLPAAPTDPGAFQVFGEKPMNLKDMLHKLHGQGFNEEEFNFLRSNPNATTGGANAYNFEAVKYPGRLDDCKTCHTASVSYDLPLDSSALWTVYEAFGGLSATTAAPSFPGQMARKAPVTAACGTCHDDSSARAHFDLNTSYSVGAEACDVCHGSGRSVDAVEAHSERNQ
jgi:OmcA/MtrC family decaheme c-type cytochrome